MREAVICEPVRTPVGRFGGMFKDTSVAHLASTVVSGLVERTGLTSGDIDDVIFGQGYANGEAAAIGRIAALDAGLDVRVPGMQIDRRCGSGLQSVLNACMQVMTGGSDLVLAGGAESMSQAELYIPDGRWNQRWPATARRPARRTTPQLGRTPVPGARRHDRDRGEPAPRVQHQPHRAGRVGGPLARARRGGDGEGPVRRRDDPGGRHRSEDPRASAPSPADEHPRPGPTVEKLAGSSRCWPAPTPTRP